MDINGSLCHSLKYIKPHIILIEMGLTSKFLWKNEKIIARLGKEEEKVMSLCLFYHTIKDATTYEKMFFLTQTS